MRVASLLVAASISCAGSVFLPNRAAKLTCSTRTAAANEILCDGAVVAVVKCAGGEGRACRALWIESPDGGRTVLYQAPNFDLDKERYFISSKASFFEWAFYPTLAPDGSKVWFKEGSLTGWTWRQYDLERQELSDIDEQRLWEAIHFAYRDRDIPLWGRGP
jgi:hypothetical protein